MNPVEDFLTEKNHGKEKRAFFGAIKKALTGDTAKNIYSRAGDAAIMTGVGAALTAGGTGAVLGAQKIYNAATSKRDFKGMMEWNQDLQDEDQKLVNQSFRTLRRFSPEFSKDPLVAGTFVRRMVQSPQGIGGVIQEAVSGADKLPNPMQKAMIESMSAGRPDVGGPMLPPHRKQKNKPASMGPIQVSGHSVPLVPPGPPMNVQGGPPLGLNFFGVPDYGHNSP